MKPDGGDHDALLKTAALVLLLPIRERVREGGERDIQLGELVIADLWWTFADYRARL